MIASGYYTNSNGVSTATARVIQFGIPRSGSTFVWQVLCDLFPGGGVIKTHDWLDLTVPVVVTLRDFRDVLVSRWRFVGGTGMMTREEIYQGCGLIHQAAWVGERYVDVEGVHVERYEHWIQRPSLLVHRLAVLFNQDGNAERMEQVAAAHALEMNRESAPSSGHWGEYDAQTLLHPGHVHEGEVGSWKRFVVPEDQQLVNDLLASPLERYGYR